MKKYKKYLKEATATGGYPDSGGIVGDDDFPTGNILMGDKYKQTGYYNRLTNFNVNWVPDDSDWTWLDIDSTIPQGSTDAYSDTLLKHFLADRLFKKMKKTGDVPDVPTSSRTLGGDIGPFTDAWGNKPEDEDDYEKTGDLEDANQDGEDDEDTEREKRKKEGRPYRPRVMKDVIKKINGLI